MSMARTQWSDFSDDVNREFFDAAARGELHIQACAACGLARHPPQLRCPSCRSADVVWEPASGQGRVWSFVTAHPPLPSGFAELVPLTVVLVELDDPAGIRLLGTLLEVAADEVPAIGDPVEAVFRSVADGPVLPHFRLRHGR